MCHDRESEGKNKTRRKRKIISIFGGLISDFFVLIKLVLLIGTGFSASLLFINSRQVAYLHMFLNMEPMFVFIVKLRLRASVANFLYLRINIIIRSNMCETLLEKLLSLSHSFPFRFSTKLFLDIRVGMRSRKKSFVFFYFILRFTYHTEVQFIASFETYTIK